MLILSLWLTTLTLVRSCDRFPKSGIRQSGGVTLTISGDPDYFVPGEDYTLLLKATNSTDESFTRFLLIADNEAEKTNASSITAGALQSYDTKSRVNDECSNAVSNADEIKKNEVQIIWTAPSRISEGMCVQLSGWAANDEESWWEFRKRICPMSSKEPNDTQPPIVEPCCACNEAKYEMVFEGLWSRHTHPKDFPKNDSLTKFSDVIGASHTAHYRFWEIGTPASDGLQLLAEHGHTVALETELKAESDHIRTIIKARGMSYPTLRGKTFAVFRVDSRHHLVSVVAQLAPSPDWFVGVSALELCRPNCSWTESRVLNLYPYDAGTDAGVSYMSHRQPEEPPGSVRPLGPDWPPDSRSPFKNLPRNELRPFARLYLNRQRQYEKSCDGNGTDYQEHSISEYGACATTSWTAWSPCSVSCGKGIQSRRRNYKDMVRAAAVPCRRILSDTQTCNGIRMHCRLPGEYERELDVSDGPCAMTKWSDWSDCYKVPEKKCGKGVMMRSRKYVRRSAWKKCHLGLNTRPQTQQTLDCDLPGADCPVVNTSDSTTTRRPRDKIITIEELYCPVTEWSEWSPCSATCGKGRRLRIRFYIAPEQVRLELHQAVTDVSNARFVSWQREDEPESMTKIEITLEESIEKLESLLTKHLPDCKMTVPMQEISCVSQNELCNITADEAKRVCILPKVVGPCRSYTERWFFEAETGFCEPFGYTGCSGNRNNFQTRDECERVCGKHADEVKTKARTMKKEKIKSEDTPIAVLKNEMILKDMPDLFAEQLIDIRDCIVTRWSSWSSCRGSCLHASQHQYRHILIVDWGFEVAKKVQQQD